MGFKHVENQAYKHTLRKRLCSQRRESRVRKEIRLQLSRHSLLYARRLKAPHCFIQAFVATNFSEHTRSQSEYDTPAILVDSITVYTRLLAALFFTWNMACILPASYTRNIPRGTKFSHELSPNLSHPVEPQMPFGNGRKYDDLPYL